MVKCNLFVAFFFATAVLFADSITMGVPNYSGTGCPAGSAALVLSPDASQLSVLFDVYTVEANATRRVDRKNCNLNVPIHVPSGYSISVIEMDYRGFSSVPDGASADLDVDAFFAGVRSYGPRHHRGFKTKTKGDFYVHNKIERKDIVWSPCGKDVNLKIHSSLIATTNSKGEQTLAAVDSLDINAGLIYQINWQACVESPQPMPPPPGPGPVPHPMPPPHPGPMPHPMPQPRPQPRPVPQPGGWYNPPPR